MTDEQRNYLFKLLESIDKSLKELVKKKRAKHNKPQLCAGGIDPGFDDCPKCGATSDDECKYNKRKKKDKHKPPNPTYMDK